LEKNSNEELLKKKLQDMMQSFQSKGRTHIWDDGGGSELKTGLGESEEKGISRKMRKIKEQAWSIFNLVGNEGKVVREHGFRGMLQLGIDKEKEM
jgi:hypothetical protein